MRATHPGSRLRSAPIDRVTMRANSAQTSHFLRPVYSTASRKLPAIRRSVHSFELSAALSNCPMLLSPITPGVALRLLGTHGPRQGNLHQHHAIFFRRGARHPTAFGGVVAKFLGTDPIASVSISILNSASLFIPSIPRKADSRGKVPVQIFALDGTKFGHVNAYSLELEREPHFSSQKTDSSAAAIGDARAKWRLHSRAGTIHAAAIRGSLARRNRRARQANRETSR